MIEFVTAVLDAASQHLALVLAAIAASAALDAALGVGIVLPGETGVVLGAIALADSPPALALGVGAAAAGAFAGDHIGFAVGRRFGPALGETGLVRRIGVDHWEAARGFVARSLWAIIVARLLPGVRTLVAAAAGASEMTYRRFALISATAATIWASIWVLGGALLGSALLDLAAQHTPLVVGAAVVIAAAVVVVRMRAAAR